MNEVKKLNKEAEISSLLLPLMESQLLLPAVTVAEMITWQSPQKDPESPDWYLGDVVWRNHRIPLISYELMSGEPMPIINNDCRIAVLNNTGVDERLSFLGVLTQGIPRLSRVTSEEIHEVADVELKRFDLMCVKHAGELLVIPNVSAIQQAVLDSDISL